MKKKLLVAALAVILVVTAIAGTSLAYLTDTDKEDNVFTVGNVYIDLTENFTQESKLLPSTGSAQNGTLKNGVDKEIFVTNTGTEIAYVRVHIAIPTVLDNGDPTFDAGKNVLHFNYESENVGANKWDWSKTTGEAYEGDWNFYTTTINEVSYNVYVVTYEKALAPNEMTVSAMDQVYLDSKVTNADLDKINAELTDGWHMYVFAEGVQADGFNDAYEALNTAFGVPGSYTPAWIDANN